MGLLSGLTTADGLNPPQARASFPERREEAHEPVLAALRAALGRLPWRTQDTQWGQWLCRLLA